MDISILWCNTRWLAHGACPKYQGGRSPSCGHLPGSINCSRHSKPVDNTGHLPLRGTCFFDAALMASTARYIGRLCDDAVRPFCKCAAFGEKKTELFSGEMHAHFRGVINNAFLRFGPNWPPVGTWQGATGRPQVGTISNHDQPPSHRPQPGG